MSPNVILQNVDFFIFQVYKMFLKQFFLNKDLFQILG